MHVFESVNLDEVLYLLMEKHMANFYLSKLWNSSKLSKIFLLLCISFGMR